MTIAAIQTTYDGYRFRSRLEARWAVFFNHLGIRYQFEPQGYQVTDGRGAYRPYLPDFCLPDLKMYAEVRRAGGGDWTTWGRFAEQAGWPLLILSDLPKDHEMDDAGGDWAHPLVTGTGRGEWFRWKAWKHGGNDRDWSQWQPPVEGMGCDGPHPPIIREAYRAARMARFEHGEAPAAPAPRPRNYRTEVYDYVRQNPWCSRTMVKNAIVGNSEMVWLAVNLLIDDGYLVNEEGWLSTKFDSGLTYEQAAALKALTAS